MIIKLRRIATVLLFAFLRLIPLAGQDININMPNSTVRQAILFLGDKYDYDFVVATKGIDMGRKVSVVASSGTIEEVLAQVFAGQDVSYSVSGKKISVKAQQTPPPVAKGQEDAAPVAVSGTVLDMLDQAFRLPQLR